ncbi:MAG: rhomboid family intramembrane serine protease [Fimbriimonadales bacterium]|nr:rhomboid family intramembrane serine protease [Fimbriimonadales bacterium]
MVPIRDNSQRKHFPWVTYTLILLLTIIYLWDREWSLFGPRVVFTDLAARPVEIVAGIKSFNVESLLTLFTSAFLHANLGHLLSNLLFLWVFGPRVEEHFRAPRYALFYLFFGVVAALTQAFVMPNSAIPMLGASGAIAGIMGCYLLLYPASEIEVFVPPLFFWTFPVPAWLMLGFWFALQIFLVQPGVANWAHAGGFLAGMLLVMIIGDKKNHDKEQQEALST